MDPGAINYDIRLSQVEILKPDSDPASNQSPSSSSSNQSINSARVKIKSASFKISAKKRSYKINCGQEPSTEKTGENRDRVNSDVIDKQVDNWIGVNSKT